MNKPQGPPLSTGLKLWLGVVAVFMVISAAVMITGVVLWRNEVDARVAGQCQVITKTRGTLTDLIEFALKPADTTGLDPVRLKVVQDLNAAREDAKTKFLPRLATLSCN